MYLKTEYKPGDKYMLNYKSIKEEGEKGIRWIELFRIGFNFVVV